MKTKKRLLSILFSLMLVLGLMPGMGMTAYAETSNTGIEVLITDIDCEHYKDKTTSFTTDDGLANISFSATPVFDEYHGWYDPNGDLTITVTAANEDYPISKCMFQCDRPGREDNTDPFEVKISYGGNWNNTTATINGVSESSGGLKHIGIYSRITPDHTALEDGMLIKPGESIIPDDYYYKTAGYVNTADPERTADFKNNTLYTLVKGNIESRQVDPSYPDWVENVFVESNNGDHYAFLQVANGTYIFDGSWEVTNHADGLLVSQGTSENMNNPEERITTYAFSVHEKVINDVTVDSTIENGSIEIKDSEGTAISEAEAGSIVTLDVSADEGYKLKEISANYLEVQSVSELMEMMGNTKYYANPNDTEYSDYYMATADGIKCFWFYGNEKAFLSKTAELDKSKSAEGVYTAIGTYDDAPLTWIFKVKNGKIISIGFERNGVDWGIVNIESTGKIAEPTYASVGLTPVTTGKRYTFTMPATDVTVNAVFAEKHTHDGIDFTAWGNATGLPDNAGNYYLTQDVILSETWKMPSGTTNLCLNGHSINGPTNENSVFNVNTNTTLNLYDCGVTAGAIIARYKNGVAVAPGSTFNLYGGKITSNTDNQAIGVENFGTFNMYGGEISGNKGTGVSNVDGTFTMTGGTIRDNGKGVANQGIFKLSGNPTITNNKSGTDDSAKDNNVSLADNKVITIDGVLSNTTPIGVTMSAPGVFTSGWNDKMSDKTPTDYFTSDDSAYTVQVDGNELKLAVIKTNPTVTAPTAKSLTYTGSAQELVNAGSTDDGTMWYAIGENATTAPEFDGDSQSTDKKWNTSIPTGTNAGTYYVWYKVVGDVNHNDTSADCVTVTISKAEVSAPTIASKTYNTQNQTATVAASDLYTVTTNEGGTNVGDYDVVLTLTDSDNYKWTDSEDAAKTLTFQITQATASAVETPTPDAVTYDPAKTLESVTLPDGWAWADSTIVPTVNNDGYSAAYTVTDDTNYDYSGIDGYSAETHKVTRTVVLTVNKADPTADAPTGLTATYGQTLADVTLTNPDGNTAGTWAWVDDTTSVGNAGSNTFKANFTPTDTTNYNGKTNVDVTVTVGKADPTATAPTATATYGDTLADVTLTNPAGNTAGTWAWVDAGTTSVGNAGSNTFKANFTPADTTNYNSKTNVTVTVTVGKADPSAEVTPVTGLVYDGKTKQLVTAEVEGGTLQYRIGKDGEWTESIPEATDFDAYTIYYYIKGDDNHKDAGSELEPLGSVEVTIKCPYSNEWVKGKWYNKDGSQTYKSLGSWQKDGTDWMYVDESGWTAKNRWQKIDFKWYFFDKEGHMLKDAYQKDASGKIWYLGKNGAWDEKAAVIGWKQDAKGWWFGLYGNDYLKDGWKMINGNWYYFKSTGYIAVNEFVQGWWLNKAGAWKDPVKYGWHKSGSKWWYGVKDGWYAKGKSYTIDGKSYTFDKNGYMK